MVQKMLLAGQGFNFCFGARVDVPGAKDPVNTHHARQPTT